MSLEQALAENTVAVKELTAMLRGQQIQPASNGQAEAPKETAAQKKAREKAEKDAADLAAAAQPATSQATTAAATPVSEEQVREAAGAAHQACLARGMSEDNTMAAVKGITKVVGCENLKAVLDLAEPARSLNMAKLVELYGYLERNEPLPGVSPAPAAKAGLDI